MSEDGFTTQWGRIGAHVSWANTKDRAARTAPARAALAQKFLDAADGDPVRAEHLRKAHYARCPKPPPSSMIAIVCPAPSEPGRS